jgi:hydroxylamine reductase
MEDTMFCYQCQETAKNSGCTVNGVCGKSNSTSDYQDNLVYVLKELSAVYTTAGKVEEVDSKAGRLISEGLFMTITNANFDDEIILKKSDEVIKLSDDLKSRYSTTISPAVKAPGVLAIENEDIRSLTELLIYGLKGAAAYAHHAAVLGFEDPEIYRYLVTTLAMTLDENDADTLTAEVLKCGEFAVKTMALLDNANTSTFGNPEITKVATGTGERPGILISGHDLKDLAELLEQSKDTGVDIYTHSEMLPAHYYPEFKKYSHLAGNYGGSWWKQSSEFESFNGAILMTTNCITPVKDTYKDRMFTTGAAGYPGVQHIADRKSGEAKDFSKVIQKALECKKPVQLEDGEIIGGFAHNQVTLLADQVVEAVKSGAVKKFVVMAGCDGRHKDREYFTDLAKELPNDTIILTAGCAKYRYNKLDLGDIGGIPRVLDAGQCNDSYSLAVIALKLKEIFELDDINKLPIDFAVAWYEQKAVAVLLALLSLGFKGIRLGPTLPGFISPNVANVLIDTFELKKTEDVKSDVLSMQ